MVNPLTVATEQRRFGAERLNLEPIAPLDNFQMHLDLTVTGKSPVSLTHALKNKYGLEFLLRIAIDATASNLANPSDSSTCDLHNMTRPEDNQYLQVIDSIGQSILELDEFKEVRLYLFGHYKKDEQQDKYAGKTIFSEYVTNVSIEKVKDSYKTEIENLKKDDLLGLQTDFCPFTERFCGDLVELELPTMYGILLIITDGILEESEMKSFIDLISSKADKGISIIIVGVGNADFKDMKKLDGDAGEDGLPTLMDSKGNRVKRDIVQFVQFGKGSHEESFKEEIFGELPKQIITALQK